MSLSGISSGFSGSVPSISQQIQSEFEQLGKDLQSGDVAAAQADFVTLQEDLAKRAAESAIQVQPQAQTQSGSSVSQASQPDTVASAQDASQPGSGFVLSITLTETISYLQSGATSPGSGSSQSSTSSQGSTAPQSSDPIAQAFQQLGKDLQAGNLTAAQTDFTTLQQDFSQSAAASSTATQSSGTIAAAFNQLSQDLQSGNLTAAQQDFTTIQQDFQAQAGQTGQAGFSAEGHRHHHDSDSDSDSGASAGASTGSGSGPGEIGKLLKELGKELQSGNLSSAQSTYASLEQDFQEFSQSGRKVAATVTQLSESSFSVSA